ncbi:MAG: multidrug effflux MFS transporter [Geminicoccaceae bacterium]
MTAGTGGRPEGSKALVVLLVAVTALAPASLQIFIPALPAIQASFGSSAGLTQLVLSLSILANAIATLAYGPLSDRYGRRPVMIAGMLIFIVGSTLCVIAPSIGFLIGARILQSAGAAAGMVLARAIIRDLYDREQAASAIAYLTMAMVVAPMISPLFGALLIDQFGWRAIFIAMTILGVTLIWLVWLGLRETRPSKAAGEASTALLRGAQQLLGQATFVRYMLQSTFAISTFFAFISGAAYFLIDVLDRSATEYGLLFMVVSGSFMVGNLTSARLSRRVGIDRLIGIGNILALLGTIFTALLMVAGIWTPWALFGPMMITGFANGLSIANAQAGAVSVNPNLAGTASGLAGFAQMFVAATVSQAVGFLQNGTPYPMVGLMTGCAFLSLACFVLIGKGSDKRA